MTTRRRWGSALATKLRAQVLARDYDPALGYAPCIHCGKPANSADHWPVARVDGAPDQLDALAAACLPCNQSRGAVLGLQRRHPPAPSRQW